MAGFKSLKSQKKRTICEVHREIYDIIIELIPEDSRRTEVEIKLEEAFEMAKKMNAKLRQYAYNYDDDWWEKENAEIRQRKETLRNQRSNKK
jgi:hypothetical protein|tara:strand:+ start:699 stop:974 length:276 start_codon:yes stop_codon:yes gene_type:complete